MGYVPAESFERRLQMNVEGIANAHNREKVALYLAEKRARGARVGTLLNDVVALRDLCVALGGKNVEDATKLDILNYANRHERVRRWRCRREDGESSIRERSVQLQTSTRCVRNMSVRLFYKWLRNTEDVPPEVRMLQTRRPRMERIFPDRLVDARTLRALLQAHPDPRERALVAVLHDTGFRAGELCALNIGSVRFETHKAGVDGAQTTTHSVVLTLPAGAPGLKTGARRIRVYECVEYLRAWYEIHPRRDNPQAPLFFGRGNRAFSARLSPGTLYLFLRRAASRAGVRKHLHPHLFRHTAATERAKRGWSEERMRAFFGWTRQSEMPSVYVHMAANDCEEIEMRERGIVNVGVGDARALAPVKCPACGALNLMTAFFCQACRARMNPDARADAEPAPE